MPLLLRFELVWSRDSLCHSLSSCYKVHSRPSTQKGHTIPSHWLISNTAQCTHTHTCITSPQATAYLSRWPEGDTKNWIDNSRWKEVNPNCISLQVRWLGRKPELFFTPNKRCCCRSCQSAVIIVNLYWIPSELEWLTNSHRFTFSIRIGAVYVGLVLDAHVLQCSRVESNKKVLSCKRPYYDTSKQHVGCHMDSGASATLSTELMLVFVFSIFQYWQD